MSFRDLQYAIYSPKTSLDPMIQPLTNLNKPLTPIKKQLIDQSPINCSINTTPININKLPQTKPINTNKENNHYGTNILKILPTSLKRKQSNIIHSCTQNSIFYNEPYSYPQKTIGMSPIMTLNKNLQESLTYEKHQKSINHSHKNQHSQSNDLEIGQRLKIQKKYHNMYHSKQIQNSNSFKDLLSTQTYHPPKLGSMIFGSFVNKSNNKQSKLEKPLNLSNSFTNGLKSKHQSERKLLNKSEAQVLKLPQCMNNDGQIAKYKIQHNDEQGEQLMMYCSRCAITLAEQGFTIEDILLKDIHQHCQYSGISDKLLRTTKQRITKAMSKLRVEKQKLNENINSELDQIDCYYNSIIQKVEDQRSIDKQLLITIYNEVKKQPENYQSELINLMRKLPDQVGKNNKSIENSIKKAQMVLQKKVQYPINSKYLYTQIQHSFNQFTQIFQHQIKLQIKQSKQKRTLRFSFDKNIHIPTNNIFMHTLKEEIDQDLGDTIQPKQSNTAFRNIFPDETQSEEGQCNNPIKSPTFKSI